MCCTRWRLVWEEVGEQEVPRVPLPTLVIQGYTRTWPRHPCFIQDLDQPWMNSFPVGAIPFLPQLLPTLLHQPCGNGQLQELSLLTEGAGQCRINPSPP